MRGNSLESRRLGLNLRGNCARGGKKERRKEGLFGEEKRREVRKYFVALRKRVNNDGGWGGGGEGGGDSRGQRQRMSDMLFPKTNFRSRYITIQQDCNSANKLAWRNNNALPCSDNKACTKKDRFTNSVCSGTPFTCLQCEECYNEA